VAELEALTRQLQARLVINATNRVLSPSANPRQAPKPVRKTPNDGQPDRRQLTFPTTDN
jgi:hypothetical protein